MSSTVTIRVPKHLAAWLQQKSRATGIPQGRLIRDQLERIRRADGGTTKFMRLAGTVRGARNLSTRKGFARS